MYLTEPYIIQSSYVVDEPYIIQSKLCSGRAVYHTE